MGLKPWLTIDECIAKFGTHKADPYREWLDPEYRYSKTGIYERCLRCGAIIDERKKQ